MTFARKNIREQLADEEENDPNVNHPDADLFARPFEASEMRGNEIDQEQAADQITAGKNRHLPRSAFWSPIYQKAAEKLILRFEQSEIDLRERAPEDQDQAQEKASDGQA